MVKPERWANTQEQIDRLQEARNYGGHCGWCGRELDEDEMVYAEVFHAGTKQRYLSDPVRPRSSILAPVGAECASPELISRAPEPCTHFGRGVVYDRPCRGRRRASCSRRCTNLAWADRRPRPEFDVPAPAQERRLVDVSPAEAAI